MGTHLTVVRLYYLTITNTSSFLVGLGESEIDFVSKLYPDDPTQVGTSQVLSCYYFTLFIGFPFRRRDE